MVATGLLVMCLAGLAGLAAQDGPTSGESAGSRASSGGESGAAGVVEPVILRYRFVPGQVFRYRSEQKMTLDAQLGQSRRVDVSEVKQTRKFTVQGVGAGGEGELSMQFEHVWMRKQVDDGAPLDFDSGMKPGDVPEAFRGVAHSLRGTAPRFYLTPLGQSAVRGAIRQTGGESGASLPSPVDAEEGVDGDRRSVGAVQQASVGSGGQSKEPVSFLMLLPAGAVKPGDTWKEEIPLTVRAGVDSTLQVSILRTYRLERLAGDRAEISFRSSLRSPSRSTVIQSQLIQATPSGSFVFDVGRGVMLSREFRYSETVIGALGAESLLASFGTQTEELLPESAVP